MRGIKLTAGLLCILLIPLTLLRIYLLIRYHSLATGIPPSTLAMSFLIGLRFDAAVCSYILLPVILTGALPVNRWQQSPLLHRMVTGWLVLTSIAIVISGLADVELFGLFNSRLNHIAMTWFNTPHVVFTMIADSFPLWPALFLLVLYGIGLGWIFDRFIKRIAASPRGSVWLDRGMYIVLIAAGIIGIRGGLTTYPLRFDYANFSEHNFANQLALNGLFNFGEDILKARTIQPDDPRLVPIDKALPTVRRLLAIPDPKDGGNGIARFDSGGIDKKLNVVLILMESLTAEFVASCGGEYDLAPEFDKMAADGMLFTRFYSNGTHTQHGLFATLTGLPIPPGGDEVLHQSSTTRQFPGIPILLKKRGYHTSFYCTHDLLFDHLKSFLTINGFDTMYGLDDYGDALKYTWGVADGTMYDKAFTDLGQLPEPFFTLLLTCSSHAPYQFPETPFRHTEASNPNSARFNAFSYADWAMAQFYHQALETTWGQRTLFIILGDHGIAWNVKQELDPVQSHIPLLLISPGYIQPGVNSEVSGQKDVLTTVMDFMGGSYLNGTLGRNLLDTLGVPSAIFSENDAVGYVLGDSYVLREKEGNIRTFRLPDVSTPQPHTLLTDSMFFQAGCLLTTANQIIGWNLLKQ